MTMKSIMNILMPKLKGQPAKTIVIIQSSKSFLNYFHKTYSAYQT